MVSILLCVMSLKYYKNSYNGPDKDVKILLLIFDVSGPNSCTFNRDSF